MTDEPHTQQDTPDGATDRQDWVIPAILVSVIVVAAVIIGIVIGISRADAEDPSPAAQLEDWTRCLRDEGAPVPLVEAVSGGGFRITVDGDVLERDLDSTETLEAFDACIDEAPEKVREVANRIDEIREWFDFSF